MWTKDAALSDDFQNAAWQRSSIPRDTKGFLRPQFDLFISLEDKPGVIAAIAGALAAAGMNIKDIEVVKVREGEAGTLRLALETREDRDKARQILTDLDYTVRLRD